MKYCKNCGKQMDDNAVVCIHCGVANGTGNQFCPNCGAQTPFGADFCTSCGVSLKENATAVNQKSKMAAGLMGIFLGGLGVHNFYLGNTTRGIIQLVLTLFSCGIGGIWGFIEGILILCGNINTDGKGNPLGE